MSLNMEMHKYLFSKRFLTLSVLTIFLFSIPLLLIYGYYSDTIWLGFNSWRSFGFTLIFYAIAISIMTLSKVVIYKYQSLHRLTMVKFILWVAVEYMALKEEFDAFLSRPVSCHISCSTAISLASSEYFNSFTRNCERPLQSQHSATEELKRLMNEFICFVALKICSRQS